MYTYCSLKCINNNIYKICVIGIIIQVPIPNKMLIGNSIEQM